ncbi:MAG: IclR family transcriptional regulator, partial [Casimicrobiaceae bacterium]
MNSFVIVEDEVQLVPAHRDSQRGIQSIDVGTRLLAVLAAASEALPLKELAGRAGMSAAKAHAYLVSFSRAGLIEQDAVTGRYDLGPLALRLGLASLNRLDPVRLATAALPELAAATGHSVAIAVWGNHGPTIVRFEQSARPIHVNMRTGTVMSMTETATGLALTAHRP